MAAYGEDSSRSALTFMPPVTRQIVSRPLESPRVLAYETIQFVFITKGGDLLALERFQGTDQTDLRSVTWTKVSLKEAKIRATPKTFSPVTISQSSRTELIDRPSEPSRTWGPREIFSVAGRSTFFLGGMLSVTVEG